MLRSQRIPQHMPQCHFCLGRQHIVNGDVWTWVQGILACIQILKLYIYVYKVRASMYWVIYIILV